VHHCELKTLNLKLKKMNKILNEKQIKTIKNFWNWVVDNETAIYNALVLDINKNEVMEHFCRNLSYVSKRIGTMIYFDKEVLSIIFTARGFRKLFPKLIAIEANIPTLTIINPMIFIKPINEKEKYLQKKDEALSIYNQSIKISDLQLKLDNFNTTTKKIDITIYHPYKDTAKMEDAIIFATVIVIGEIAFKKHLKQIEVKPLTKVSNGLLPLIELDEFISYLYKCMDYKRIKI
jgi:hypothetical protein